MHYDHYYYYYQTANGHFETIFSQKTFDKHLLGVQPACISLINGASDPDVSAMIPPVQHTAPTECLQACWQHIYLYL